MGTTLLSAELSGITGATTLAVSDPILASLEVTPSHTSAALGTTQAFVATGDLHGQLDARRHRERDLEHVGSRDRDGLECGCSRGRATTVAVGSATIAAALEGKSGATVFTVSAADLVVIAVSPDAATLAAGTSQAFTALALLSDGTRQDLTDQVTWSSSDDSIATVSGAAGSHGLVTSVGGRQRHDLGRLRGDQRLGRGRGVVGTLVSIDISPFVSSIAKGTHLQFSARGELLRRLDAGSDLPGQLVDLGRRYRGDLERCREPGTRDGHRRGDATITAEFSGVTSRWISA
jgi:hypothetical protein